jgi:hypothetical protein
LARLLLYKVPGYAKPSPFFKESAQDVLPEMYQAVNEAVQIHGGYGLMKEYLWNVITGTETPRGREESVQGIVIA